jgi:hypothetical protein
MEFIMGIYDGERSGETERIRTRGSGRSVTSVGELGDEEGCTMRLMSKIGWMR